MKKTWVPLLSAYPAAGLSHRLDQDKQHELAHAVRYDDPSRCGNDHSRGVSYTNADAPLRIFWSLVNLRDSAAEDNVRKRPFLPVK